MKVLTKYVSDDGLEFTNEQACISYEALCKDVAGIMHKLAPRPDLPSCSFENGAGYIQHDPNQALQAKREILAIANKIWPHQWFEQSLADEAIDPSWAGRLISEMSQKCIYQACTRFQCMDKQYREWGQPYYALHPEQAKNIRLN